MSGEGEATPHARRSWPCSREEAGTRPVLVLEGLSDARSRVVRRRGRTEHIDAVRRMLLELHASAPPPSCRRPGRASRRRSAGPVIAEGAGRSCPRARPSAVFHCLRSADRRDGSRGRRAQPRDADPPRSGQGRGRSSESLACWASAEHPPMISRLLVLRSTASLRGGAAIRGRHRLPGAACRCLRGARPADHAGARRSCGRGSNEAGDDPGTTIARVLLVTRRSPGPIESRANAHPARSIAASDGSMPRQRSGVREPAWRPIASTDRDPAARPSDPRPDRSAPRPSGRSCRGPGPRSPAA